MFRTYKRRVTLFFSSLLLFLAGSAPGIAPERAAGTPEQTAAVAPLPASAPSPPPSGTAMSKRNLLAGTWRGGGCTYRIDSDGMVRIQRIGVPGDSLRGRYAWFRMGDHDCISMQRENGDSLSLQVMLIGEVTDSRAVIALGTPFMRMERGKGIPGPWKHVDRLSRMEWKFGSETVEYRRTRINLQTGEEQVLESRAGSYHGANENYEDGSFQLSFQDGSGAVVLPIVYRNLMYLFDLTPVKSLFTRVREPVTDAGRFTGGNQQEKNRKKD